MDPSQAGCDNKPINWVCGSASLDTSAARPDLARLLASVDVFVHPNPHEPFGIGPLEAMASGTPLVAPGSGGVLEYADASCAWLAQPHGDAFAHAVLEVLSNTAAARIKIERARSVAERHDWRNVTEQFFASYDELHATRQIVRQGWGFRLDSRVRGDVVIEP